MRQVPLSCLEWGCDHQCLLFKAWGGALLKHTSLSQDGKPGHGTGQILFCSFTRREWELRGCVYCILDDSCILGLICPHHHHDHPGRKPSLCLFCRSGYEAPLRGEPCWKHRDHLLLSDRVGAKTLLGLGVRSAVSFLHPGSVWSMREKHFFYHSSLIHLWSEFNSSK